MGSPWQSLAAVLALWSVAAAPAEAARKALVIGNAQYFEEGRLAHPVSDARAMDAKLRSLGFEVTLLLDAELKKMAQGITKYAKSLDSSDESFVFYAGHGVQIRDANYLVPVDFRAETQADAQRQAYELSQLIENIEEHKPRLSVVVLDACRNNPFPALRRSRSRGLRSVDSSIGSVIAFATAPGKTASDESIFVKVLLQHLGDRLEVRQMFNRVADIVAKETSREQVPWISASALSDAEYSLAPEGARLAPRESGSGPQEAQPVTLPAEPSTAGIETVTICRDADAAAAAPASESAVARLKFEATNVLKLMVEKQGLTTPPEVKVERTLKSNGQARLVLPQAKRLILLNADTMGKLKKLDLGSHGALTDDDDSDHHEQWRQDIQSQLPYYVILAHELGHHQNHQLDSNNGFSQFERELNADYFAGHLLGQLMLRGDRPVFTRGLQGLRKFWDGATEKYHLALAVRLECIVRGFDDAADWIPDGPNAKASRSKPAAKAESETLRVSLRTLPTKDLRRYPCEDLVVAARSSQE